MGGVERRVTPCVLDASCTLPWLFEREASAAGDAMLLAVQTHRATIPALWFLEIANGLGIAERRGRLTKTEVEDATALLHSLPLTVDEPASLAWTAPVLDLMRAHRLTAYDAANLERALRLSLPLATLDRELLKATPSVGVASFEVL